MKKRGVCFLFILLLPLMLCGNILAFPFAYVQDLVSEKVCVIDTETDTVVATVTTGHPIAGIAVNPLGGLRITGTDYGGRGT